VPVLSIDWLALSNRVLNCRFGEYALPKVSIIRDLP